MAEPTLSKKNNCIVLFDALRVPQVADDWFDQSYWRRAGKVVGEAAGRGSVVFVQHDEATWVLRHYHRGGVVGRFVSDQYLWRGAEETRAFREWRLLSKLRELGLPVPIPVAARICRSNITYTADLLTEYLENTRSMESLVIAAELEDAWTQIGSTLRRFHDHGVNHSDLNVRNILLDDSGQVFLVDFDKGEVRGPGSWREANIRRLKRSLLKVALETGTQFDADGWRALERGYESLR